MPAEVNVRLKVCPVPKTPESHRPVSLVVVWGEPTQVQVIVSLMPMFAVFGENAKFTMFMLAFTARAGRDQLKTAKARPQRAEWKSRFPRLKIFIFLFMLLVFCLGAE